MGSLSDGGCADASGMLSWYRVSSFLLNHDPGATQARCSPVCSATPDGSPWHTRCLRSSCPPSSFTAQPSALASLVGIGVVSPGHTLAAVAVLRSLACTSPPVAIARAQHQAWNKFKARCCRTDNSGIDEHGRNRYCVSDALTHVSIITAQCQNRPAYSVFLKASL